MQGRKFYFSIEGWGTYLIGGFWVFCQKILSIIPFISYILVHFYPPSTAKKKHYRPEQIIVLFYAENGGKQMHMF